MMQKIIIKNFGPVKDCALTLHNFMILIGEQPQGKAQYVNAFTILRRLEMRLNHIYTRF